MSIRKQVMMGMMGAGKSTYIAALYHVVESSEVPDSLQLALLADDRQYLVDKRNEWLGCVEFDRTKLGKEQVLTLMLKDPASGNIVELVLPDFSGETFRDQWEHRRSTELFDELARESEGVLFFIHPETVTDGVRINKVKEIASILEDGESSENEEPAEAKNASVEWEPSFAPTQVKLVEVLQFLLRDPHIYPVKKVAVIVSAWDLVKTSYKGPNEWVSKRLPLLSQFLVANSDRVVYKSFGISAQGGALGEDNSALLSKTRQSDRIEVVTEIPDEYAAHDITAPIKWLMRDEESDA